MKKKLILKIILISVVLAVFIDIFFARLISAKLSTWPLLNRLQILNPEAPIVINTREEVRVSETGDVVKAVNAIKSKISAVVLRGNNSLSFAGSALNITSDGLFLTMDSVVEGRSPNQLLVKLDNGKVGEVMEIISDPATALVMLKTDLNGMGLAELGESSQLMPGEKLVLLDSGLEDYLVSYQDAYVSEAQAGSFLERASSDFPARTFVISAPEPLAPGEVAADLKNKVMGLRDKDTLISSEIIKDFLVRFLANSGNTLRPAYGFEYRMAGKLESDVLGVPFGAVVEKVSPGSAAQKAGLKLGDVITAVNNTDASPDNPLEKLLGRFKPGDEVVLSILRQDERQEIIISPTELE